MKIFDTIGKFTITKFIQYFKEISFNTSTVIWQEGDEPTFFFVLVEGKVELYKYISEESNAKKKVLMKEFISPSKRRKITVYILSIPYHL